MWQDAQSAESLFAWIVQFTRAIRNVPFAAPMNWGDNFGFIAIDWDRTDPRISLQIRDVEGDIMIQQKINLSTIRRKATRPH